MPPSKYERAELDGIRPVAFDDISRKVSAEDIVEVGNSVDTLEELLMTIPDIDCGKDFKALAKALAGASRSGKTSILLMGAHVIKCGLANLIIRLAERGVFSSVSMTGAGAIHDMELALWGRTSERVDETLRNGTFGMSRETAQEFMEGVEKSNSKKLGLGEALGELLSQEKAPHKQSSVLARCYELEIPVTVHLAIGADIVNVHPVFDPQQAASASFRDLEILTGQVCRLSEGAVVLNVGSAVFLPEVFLKCLSAARNLGFEAAGFLAANLDMIQHYRAVQNVVVRPVESPERRILITGRHELMIPLLTAAILHELRS